MVGIVYVGILCNASECIYFLQYVLYYNMLQEKDEVLSQYEYRKEIVLGWIQKNTANVA